MWVRQVDSRGRDVDEGVSPCQVFTVPYPAWVARPLIELLKNSKLDAGTDGQVEEDAVVVQDADARAIGLY